MNAFAYQRTVAKPVRCSGIGLHSGKRVSISILPAPINHGVRFIRKDLPNSPSLKAHFNMVVDTSLATVIGYNGFIVSTVEHLMATLSGLAIDNVMIELNSYEVPVMDGSAQPFAVKILAAGIKEQSAPRFYFVIKQPIELVQDGKSVCIYPAEEFKITYTIDFDHPVIGKQTLSFPITENTFLKEISPARTFGFLHEVEYMKQFGLALGGSLDNAVVVDTNSVLNKEGLRFTDEFVRHKLLDCIGDLSLLGMPILGHVVALKSGHAFNHAFLKTFFKHKNAWDTGTIMDLSHHDGDHLNSLAI